MRFSRQLHFVIACVSLAAFGIFIRSNSASAENWPAWRGANGDGVSSETGIPTHWSREENVRWHVALPEPGNSTPIVWQDRIYLTQPVAKENLRTLMCIDRNHGKTLWTAEVRYGEPEPSHKTNPYCSASPVTDGERIVAWFGSAGLYCYDMDGKQLWRRNLGKQNHIWGYAASPVLYENLCILNFGPGEREFVLAVDKTTGKTVWQVDALDDVAEAELSTPGTEGNAKRRDKGVDEAPPKRAEILRGSWSTPLIVRDKDRATVVISHPHRVTAYDPSNGKVRWMCRGLGPLVYSSPVFGESYLVSMSGYHGASLAVRYGGRGDVTDTRRLWHIKRNSLRLGCGVVTDGNLFVSDMRGIAQCIDLRSGEALWEERLRGTAGNNATWASMVLAEDKLYLLNQSGDTFVVRAAPDFELIATNSLGETTNSSIVISDGEIFARTHESLWCIRQER